MLVSFTSNLSTVISSLYKIIKLTCSPPHVKPAASVSCSVVLPLARWKQKRQPRRQWRRNSSEPKEKKVFYFNVLLQMYKNTTFFTLSSLVTPAANTRRLPTITRHLSTGALLYAAFLVAWKNGVLKYKYISIHF